MNELLFGTQQVFLFSVVIIFLFTIGGIMSEHPNVFTPQNVMTIEVMAFLTAAIFVIECEQVFGIIPGVMIGYCISMTIMRTSDKILFWGYILLTYVVLYGKLLFIYY